MYFSGNSSFSGVHRAESGYLIHTIIPKRLIAIAIIVIKTIKVELSFSNRSLFL